MGKGSNRIRKSGKKVKQRAGKRTKEKKLDLVALARSEFSKAVAQKGEVEAVSHVLIVCSNRLNESFRIEFPGKKRWRQSMPQLA